METYTFNLTDANQILENNATNIPLWQREYSTREHFPIHNFTYYGWNDFTRQLINDNNVLQEYYQKYYRYSDLMPSITCNTSCKDVLIEDIIIGNPYNEYPKSIFSTG